MKDVILLCGLIIIKSQLKSKPMVLNSRNSRLILSEKEKKFEFF